MPHQKCRELYSFMFVMKEEITYSWKLKSQNPIEFFQAVSSFLHQLQFSLQNFLFRKAGLIANWGPLGRMF